MDLNPQPSNEAEEPCQGNHSVLNDCCQKSPQDSELPHSNSLFSLEDLTVRDFANVLVVGAFRNGFIETLHAGDDSEFLADPSLSRITDLEMKKLNIETSARLAHLLGLFFENSDGFAREFLRLREYTRGWEREAESFKLPDQFALLPKCDGCTKKIYSKTWHFCPWCGRTVAVTS